ncbi:hypothetical protein PIGHUM_01804 [Pigmentiphaga humi]|uniref:SOS cell division inhibitor n=1 Tax=Pigmentiphaga humi TaxID=2478468 RepID=A0A3P4B1J1_9BURK|nr:hypothetical protein [Pigmentiphaga humi]VCU69741.1 hypothetical protein PIGHUM_01804 [Pigmentiphaga humi]
MRSRTPSLSTGFPELDNVLPQGGWPVGALTEMLVPRVGHGELSLLGPLLRRLTAAGRMVALLVPPHLAYVPALIQQGVALSCVKVIRTDHPLDGLPGMEDALQSGEFAALVAVLPPNGLEAPQPEGTVRRLQLAARLAACPAFLFHTCSTPETTSASQLRLLVDMSQPSRFDIRPIAPAPSGQDTATVTLCVAPQATPPSFRRAAGPVAGSQPAAPHASAAGTRRHGPGTPEETSSTPGTGQQEQEPAPRPLPGGRSPWPFKQRRSAVGQGGYSATLAMLFSRGWNA